MSNRMRFAARLLAGACAASVAPAFVESGQELDKLPAAQAIPGITQQLVDALPGNPAVWRRYLSEQVVFVSETGEVANKAELLEGFAPFPPG